MPDSGLSAAQLLAIYRDVFTVGGVALAAGVALALLAQAAVMALCWWEMLRKFRPQQDSPTAPRNAARGAGKPAG